MTQCHVNVYGLLRVICFPWQAYHVYPELVLPLRIARHLQVAARCFTPSLSHLFTFSPLHFVSLPYQKANCYAVDGVCYPTNYWCLHQRFLPWTIINTCFQSRNECWMRTERWTLVVRTLCASVGIYRLWVWSRWCGMLFHVTWNAVPDDM